MSTGMKDIQKKEIRDLVGRNKELEEVISEIRTTLKTIKKAGTTRGQAHLRQARKHHQKRLPETRNWTHFGSS